MTALLIETTAPQFSGLHHGDLAQVRRPNWEWSTPYRLLGDPAPCGDSTCSYLHCNAVDGMGRIKALAEPSDAPVWLLEHGPTGGGR